MTRKLLIATHGTFAEGIKSSLELIIGKQDFIHVLCAYTEGISEIKKPIKNIISSLKPDEEIIIATDLLGGSINNEFMNYISFPNVHLICGVNLPLLLEIVLNIQNENIEKLIGDSIKIAQEQIQYCNCLLEKNREISEAF
ncbi:PTS sugar transporter subunit IIA [Irregularibacter muris]|uniref:PTS sugar transporter subunit IIA n=1 Tax=Irregularibacter muris TaxID=1796619 RepID=A0AAE3HFU2_9FIRM|nr:PTS sugar transporter subunit IIA [Irregularibacter muris]MCR1898249.1 PTS sugar transporter subunit IIA [Irregularibacter muris]